MADQNSLNKPDGTSNYSTEVWQTMRAHVLRLWKGDYTGMGDLVAGLRRWVRVGSTDVKLVERAADGSETTIFDTSNKADALEVTAALAAKAPLAGRTNWVEKNVIPVVAGMIPWRNYGNGHVVFDASAGTSPEGTVVSRVNAINYWQASYPTLMGWNGVTTYGVRVDSARVADSADGTLGGGQIFMDVKAFRALGVTYTNTTSRPIFISIDIFLTGSDARVYVENKEIQYMQQQTFVIQNACFIVGVNKSYSITYSTSAPSAISKWHEFREY
jgi:hypothetical protein